MAWEPLVIERTIPKRKKRWKYQELVAELAHQWPGYKIKVVPVVLGRLGFSTAAEVMSTPSSLVPTLRTWRS